MFEVIDKSIESGIRNYIHLMYNTPCETMEDVRLFIGLVERYINSDQVVFIPHRFLLEPQSLMYKHPHQYGLTGIKKLETKIFEREQYVFEEAGVITYEQIGKRNEKHRKILEPCLEQIDLMNAKYNQLREQM